MARSGKSAKEVAACGLPLVDALSELPRVELQDYVRAVSQYVLASELPGKETLTEGQKKSAQIRLSNGLGKALAAQLQQVNPQITGIFAGERDVAGALRVARADVSESHPLDGLRLAVEIKPVNLAVGRAIWNRFGDIRTFAVNLHLKFPFAVVGGVLVVPLIERAIQRFVRAGGRRTEGDAAHLLEAICVLVYDPDTATVAGDSPPVGTGLRWDEFVEALSKAYESRFES
jgi:hypothetical protein